MPPENSLPQYGSAQYDEKIRPYMILHKLDAGTRAFADFDFELYPPPVFVFGLTIFVDLLAALHSFFLILLCAESCKRFHFGTDVAFSLHIASGSKCAYRIFRARLLDCHYCDHFCVCSSEYVSLIYASRHRSRTFTALQALCRVFSSTYMPCIQKQYRLRLHPSCFERMLGAWRRPEALVVRQRRRKRLRLGRRRA